MNRNMNYSYYQGGPMTPTVSKTTMPTIYSDHSDYMDIYCSTASILLEDTIAEQVVRTQHLLKVLDSIDSFDDLKESK